MKTIFYCSALLLWIKRSGSFLVPTFFLETSEWKIVPRASKCRNDFELFSFGFIINMVFFHFGLSQVIDLNVASIIEKSENCDGSLL